MKAKKKFGQNFLNNEDIIQKIISLLSCDKNDLVIEIGPGMGALTKYLNNLEASVVCFEIDTDMKTSLSLYKHCEIIYEDILNVDLNSFLINRNFNNIYVIGNLPYYITSPILTKLINSNIPFKNMIFMVQKEVADRFSSKNGSSDYGYMSVFLNHYYDVNNMIYVPRKYFNPVPNVDSEVIMLSRKNNIINIDSKYFDFVRKCFMLKRKNLRNNLREYDSKLIDDILSKYGKSSLSRAEELSSSAFIDLYNNLK